MGILALILFGLIAGAIAKFAMPGNDPGGGGFMGLLITIGIGIIGAFIGGFVASFLGLGSVTGFNPGSFLIAIAGAILFLAIWRAVSGGRRQAV